MVVVSGTVGVIVTFNIFFDAVLFVICVATVVVVVFVSVVVELKFPLLFDFSELLCPASGLEVALDDGFCVAFKFPLLLLFGLLMMWPLLLALSKALLVVLFVGLWTFVNVSLSAFLRMAS